MTGQVQIAVTASFFFTWLVHSFSKICTFLEVPPVYGILVSVYLLMYTSPIIFFFEKQAFTEYIYSSIKTASYPVLYEFLVICNIPTK